MKKLPIDLICVDGRLNLIDLCLSLKAVEISMQNLNFNSVKFLSPYKPYESSVQHIKINPILNLSDYSDFMLQKLTDYVESNHCLCIQNDGFIVRPNLWSDEFLKYDYIGSPWPKNWPQSSINRVGNGGFSLRSKKLLDETKKIDGKIPQELEYLSKYISHKNLPPNKIEDNMISIYKKNELESNGIKFAPIEIAAKFAIENPIDENISNEAFGFHGKHQIHMNKHNFLYKCFDLIIK